VSEQVDMEEITAGFEMGTADITEPREQPFDSASGPSIVAAEPRTGGYHLQLGDPRDVSATIGAWQLEKRGEHAVLRLLGVDVLRATAPTGLVVSLSQEAVELGRTIEQALPMYSPDRADLVEQIERTVADPSTRVRRGRPKRKEE